MFEAVCIGDAEDSIKVEEAIDTKFEIPEDISFPPIKNEDESCSDSLHTVQDGGSRNKR